MVASTRNRKKQQQQQQQEKEEKEELPKSSAQKKTKKQQRTEELKSKNTGVGLKISIDSASSNKKKTVFDDDEIPEMEEDKEQVAEPTLEDDDASDDDDDDDAVEEVQGQAAREKVLEQIKAEEEQAVRPKKKKKRKERKEEEKADEEEDEEDFDENFFMQLDTVRAAQEEKAKQKPKGKHTTFVFQQQEGQNKRSEKVVDHNIQVVVLKANAEDQDTTENAILTVPTNALSKEALLYSRSQLVDGSDARSPDGTTGDKRKRQQETTWKRSRKMNHLTLARARVNRRGGKGRAAPNFAKKR